MSVSVLAFLAIFRQIRDFGLLSGDGKFELAMYRQSPNFRDLEPLKLAILVNSGNTWRFWRNIEEEGQNPEKIHRQNLIRSPKTYILPCENYFFKSTMKN